MEKCNVCGKTTLLPTKFGVTNVCKKCYIKAGGPMWHHCYDKYEDVQKHREKALESTKKQNFPDAVIEVIDQFFLDQVATMRPCVCCGETVQQIHKVGKADLCKSCFGKINTEAWKHADYLDNEEVENNRKKILKIASKKKFPQVAIDGINAHFDQKIQKGLIVAIDNEEGQILKVFDTHIELTTTKEFDIESTKEEIQKLYEEHREELQKAGEEMDGAKIKGLAIGAISGFMKGGIIGAATGAVGSALTQAGSSAPRKQTSADWFSDCDFPIGKHKLDYGVYDSVKCYGSENLGAIILRFGSNQSAIRQKKDLSFVYYMSDDKKFDVAIDNISKGIERSKSQQQTKAQQSAQLLAQSSVADELLKFKQLLDAGAITQEEYDAKKKQLLNL